MLDRPGSRYACARGQERWIAEFPKLSAQRDWPWWRGPTRNGIAVGAAPTKFAIGDALWKTPVPGRGHSSPIVVGDRVFLTTADMQQKRQLALAYDRRTGRQLWQVEISRGGFPARNHPKNTEATPTIACDGERLFVTFFHHEKIEATALDLDGNKLWQKTAGPFNPRKYEYGYAPSPQLYRGSVIVAGEYDGQSFLVALDRASGDELWRTARPNNISFSSPVIGNVSGRDQLLISGADHVASYDPATGKQLWNTPGTTQATCGTLVWEKDIVFASGGYPKSETLAIQGDGSRVLWKNNQNLYEQSLLGQRRLRVCLHGQRRAVLLAGRRRAGDVEAAAEGAGQRVRRSSRAGTSTGPTSWARCTSSRPIPRSARSSRRTRSATTRSPARRFAAGRFSSAWATAARAAGRRCCIVSAGRRS